ncbi:MULTISPECIES: nucleotide exchange factor GrpE [Roseivirga]|uniref:Protein GrpE n=1 Tax=Roseivirga spongicola TaxID=333140 RepID=A0A150XIH1_9BACT|nr:MULTISPECIES: nucleotide exchange factor GrpE [Roseivirga]KYG78517.1 molecular chaperone GrpE [Roseivirga spongicola]MBO6661408.1 nucleotide exchange factor GrpE [Roseivirga sp.]MBO6760583.1 nucleotide exchange factor GrpE [Roseivirga sp.]MBO6908608.1 nucleotide exchange factor GrpE [Roseivirga sp.]WPZ11509.1 nucleotide exchange factor GrpE [Roseivirga spongicola]
MAKDKKASKNQEENEVLEAENQTATEDQVEDNSAKEEQVEEQEELSAEEKLEIELAEAKDKYLRLYSEFENFRRRNAKERIDLIKTASSDLMVELLPTIDDFERAKKANENQEDIESVKEGFGLISTKLFKTLESKGLKVMETEKGTPFDADLHEAVTQFPVEDEELKGKIIDTVEKGYYLGERVIRFAKVVIGA